MCFLESTDIHLDAQKKLDAKKYFFSEKNDFEKNVREKFSTFCRSKFFGVKNIFCSENHIFGRNFFSIQKMSITKNRKLFSEKIIFFDFSFFSKPFFSMMKKYFPFGFFLEERSRSLLSFLRRYDI